MWNILVTRDGGDAYLSVCETSYLNPANNATNAKIFLDAVDRAAAGAAPAKRCVLGLQEFPEPDTARGDAFEAAFKSAGFALIRGQPGNCCIAHRGFEGNAVVVAEGADASRGVDCEELMRSLTRDEKGEPVYDKKTTKSFEETTARKLLGVELDGVAYGRRADLPSTNRGDSATATWMCL